MWFVLSAGFRWGTADFSVAIADKEDHRPVFAKFVLRDDRGMTGRKEDDKSRITFDRARLRRMS